MQEAGEGRMPHPDEVSGVLREILSGPEFATFEEGARWQFLRWLGDLLADAWRWVRQLLGEQTGAAEIATILVVVAAGLILVRLAARHAPTWLRREGEEGGGMSPGTPVSAGEWLKLATERAGRGELRPAATALYQGFLLTLEKRGALSFHGSKTPGDYGLEIDRADGGVAAAGGRFLASFQDFSFGQDAPTTEGYAGLARLARDAGCRAGEPERFGRPAAVGADDDGAGTAGGVARGAGDADRAAGDAGRAARGADRTAGDAGRGAGARERETGLA